MGTLTPSARGQARGLYRATTMLCPRLDISTVGWHTLAFSRGHSPSRPALSSLLTVQAPLSVCMTSPLQSTESERGKCCSLLYVGHHKCD